MRRFNNVLGPLMVTCLVTMAVPALAWSEVARFTDAPSGGGGGFRFFTGSPADPYTCASCHTGPGGLQLAVFGLPATYLPGVTYDVTVSWSAGVSHVAGMLEIVNELGEAAGELSIVAPAEADPASLCAGGFSPMSVFARTPTVAGMRRQVLGASSCEATRIQARWKAPDLDVGAVNLVGGFVKPDDKPADAEATPQDDRVTILHHVIASPSEPSPQAAAQTFGCQLMTGSRASAPLAWLGCGFIAAFAALRLRRRVTPRR